jgi:hypothetical protein
MTRRVVLGLLTGIALGIAIGLVIRPVIVGAVAGVIVGLRIAQLAHGHQGVLFGAGVGFVVGLVAGPRQVLIGVGSISAYVALGLTGALVGALPAPQIARWQRQLPV